MSYSHITPNQRVELSALLRTNLKRKDIARILNKDPSTVSREVKRNSKDGIYDARTAKKKTIGRRLKANQRFRKIEKDDKLKKYIIDRLKNYWSPEQIAGRMKKEHGRTVVCHETIYGFVYSSRPDLRRYLRCRKGKYRRRYGTKIREKIREEAKKTRIDQRPDIVDKRERLGDWEGDTIRGKEKTISILTHVERKSGYLAADKLDQVLAETVREKTISRFSKFSKTKRYTITYDNGTEFSDYEFIGRDLKMQIYFAYPYHSWERGTNENTNGLLRQFFPKRSCFANITEEQLNKAVKLLNHRPRKRLCYLTPYEVFNQR